MPGDNFGGSGTTQLWDIHNFHRVQLFNGATCVQGARISATTSMATTLICEARARSKRCKLQVAVRRVVQDCMPEKLYLEKLHYQKDAATVNVADKKKVADAVTRVPISPIPVLPTSDQYPDAPTRKTTSARSVSGSCLAILYYLSATLNTVSRFILIVTVPGPSSLGHLNVSSPILYNSLQDLDQFSFDQRAKRSSTWRHPIILIRTSLRLRTAAQCADMLCAIDDSKIRVMPPTPLGTQDCPETS
ncbi:hypothetical protein C8R45DRAFT_1080745, partial [Mycena sanguinolenta]